MTQGEILAKIGDLIDHSKTAVLATTDSQGMNFTRWMTPTLLYNRHNCIYCFTMPDSAKVSHINQNSNVHWMFQNKSLSEIINVHCTADIIDMPAIKTELMDELGSRLSTFWHANAEKDEFVVIESTIKEACYFQPMKSLRQHVEF